MAKKRKAPGMRERGPGVWELVAQAGNCALRAGRDIDWESRILTISHNRVKDENGRLVERPTKNRRRRYLAMDDRTATMLPDQIDGLQALAAEIGCEVAENPFVFTDSEDGSTPWDPEAITQYFMRLRDREDLKAVNFKALRKFMDTYGQELGFSLAQVAVRAGHDPSVASKHYTGRVDQADRALAEAMASLLGD